MRRAASYLAWSLVVLAAFGFGFVLTQAERGTTAAAPPAPGGPRVSVLDEVREELTSSYYRWIDPAVLQRPTVEQVLAGLDDPDTAYLTRPELARLQESTTGTYSGVGLTVAPARRGIRVTSAPPGPAYDAGVREDDLIVRIDGEPVRGLAFERSLALITGTEGTIVRLTVKRPREGRLEFDVVRTEIEIPPIAARMIQTKDGPVGYLRVFSFPAGASQRIERATSRLVRKGALGLVIDLRDNPGGLLSEAVAAASIYIEAGIVCRTAGLHEDNRTFRVTGTATHAALPLAVLVNRSSASSAEIVAGALADHDRATLVGQRTFGKASVQTVAPLSDGGALKLTTAKYVTPAGADITGRGIEPPVVAVDDPLTRRDEALRVARRELLDVVLGG